jgi:lycopene beta-cyclase
MVKEVSAKPFMRNAIDIAIVGGGLAGGLIALALRQRRPELRLALIESGATLGGEHTWSFHDGDVSGEGATLLAPLVVHRWASQRVEFPEYTRTLPAGYNSITSERFDSILKDKLGVAVRLDQAVEKLSPQHIQFKSGETMTAGAIIDCRGELKSPHLALGFQKFVGQAVRLAAPHGLAAPIIMDATIPQLDGYRFFYVLPFDDRTLLIEDTRYADGPVLSADVFRAEIAAYAAARGWKIETVEREEEGVLPIALAGDIEAFWDDAPAGAEGHVARGGMRAALFHPLTGYSLPDAVALALAIAETDDLSAPALYALTRDFSVRTWRSRSYYRLLTRMLFMAAEPEKRYRVLERFYKMPEALIERFYAGRSTLADKARLLAGKPPVPVTKAARVLNEASAFSRAP